MGEKVYKPIVKDGDHLIRSKDNPDRNLTSLCWSDGKFFLSMSVFQSL